MLATILKTSAPRLGGSQGRRVLLCATYLALACRPTPCRHTILSVRWDTDPGRLPYSLRSQPADVEPASRFATAGVGL